MRKRRLLLLAFILGALSAGVVLLDFIRFVDNIRDLKEVSIGQVSQATDAIVVLTGGSERVTTGIELLSYGKAKKLFISGVYPGISLDHLIAAFPVSSTLRSCCIILGHTAGSTHGNAEETRDWMNNEEYHSLRLVTANYHMRRSLLIFHNIMPNIMIIPHPVTPENLSLDQWYTHPGTSRVLFTEYIKYLYARLRIKVGL